MRFIQLGSRF
uniref:Uncharacterized protein n=1 Tax=Arundo donax TaxID=35708 RepID=A0A0A8ZMM8_ARUDO